MQKKTIVNMARLTELRDKGYSNKIIARTLHISLETVRTIVGGVERDPQYHGEDQSWPPYRKCA